MAAITQAWRVRAAEFRRYGAEPQALTLEAVADEVDAALAAQAGELLTLERAAELSGYNADSLRRMAREKKLPAQRRGRRLYFRAGDLPRKPVEAAPDVDGPRLLSYDPVADARMVAGQRQRGD